jgi:NitT/TauT family transport system substrate-binding protein
MKQSNPKSTLPLTRFFRCVIPILAIAALTLTGCGGESSETGPASVDYGMLRTAMIEGVAINTNENDLWHDSLAVNVIRLNTGRETGEALVAERSDISTLAEWPFLLATRQDSTVRALAVVTSAYSLDIIGRRSAGVSSVEDLEGKRIGVTEGTTGQFVLNGYLLDQGISNDEYEIVNLGPSDLVAAFSRGDVDAICTWEPNVQRVREQVDDAVSLGARQFFKAQYILATRRQTIKDRPEVLRQVLESFIRGENYIQTNPDSAMSEIADFTGTGRELVREVRPYFDFKVRLSDSLSTALRREEDWAARNNVLEDTVRRDWREFIHPDLLSSIDSSRVTLTK